MYVAAVGEDDLAEAAIIKRGFVIEAASFLSDVTVSFADDYSTECPDKKRGCPQRNGVQPRHFKKSLFQFGRRVL